MKTPLVTVIIPTHNREKLIKRAINSVLNQTYQNLEILVIDDASTDNTRQVVEKYEDKRINFIQLAENKGQCIARNNALRHAHGSYIAFLDSDDEWLPQKTEKQVKLFQETEYPDLAAVYCGFIEKDEILNTSVTINRDNLRGNIYKNLLSGFCPSTTTMFMVKTNVLKEVDGFDEDIKTFVDLDLWLRISRKGYTFDYVDEPLIIKHEHKGSQMAKDFNLRKKGISVFLDKWGQEIKSHAGIKSYNQFKRSKTEAMVKSMIEKPGLNPGKNLRKGFKELIRVKSINVRLYAKTALAIFRS